MSQTSFTLASAPRGLTVGDFNEDGIRDLAVAAQTRLYVLLGQGSGGVGNGSFANPVGYAGPSPWGVSTGDFNGDGITDLAVANGTASEITIYPGLGSGGVGDGTFGGGLSVAVSGGQREVAVGDFNHDGFDDLATGSGTRVSVLLGLGNFTFTTTTYTTLQSSNSIRAFDFTGDGILDLVATDPGPGRIVLLGGSGTNGVGDGTFAYIDPYPTTTGCVGLCVSDLDENGFNDLIVTSASDIVSWLQGRCSSVVTDAPPVISLFSPVAGSVGDLVTLLGQRLANPISVDFNGTPAAVVSSSFSRLDVTVPIGATTGPIHVTNSFGTGTTPSPFLVGDRPVVTSAVPDSGKVGAVITLAGEHFLGATQV